MTRRLTLAATPATPATPPSPGVLAANKTAKSIRESFRNVRATTIVVDPLDDGGAQIAVTYHRTTVARVTYAADGRLAGCVLNTGGWRSMTTKGRINDVLSVLDVRLRLTTHRGVWTLMPPFSGEGSFAGGVPSLPYVDHVDVARWATT